MHICDSQPHPVTGSTVAIGYDSTAYTCSDANTLNFTRMNAGKAVQMGTVALSSDGKTVTVTTKGTNAAGQPINSVAVCERQ
jgi:hypothetical protein